MISGNYNRSPQYTTMGPTGVHQRQHHPFAQQQHHPQLFFMAGGSVNGFPQMPMSSSSSSSRGFSTMMRNRGPMRPTVVKCDMQQSFGGGYGYSGNPATIFHPHYPQSHQHHHHQPQPQVIHHTAPQQYIQQSFITPQTAANTVPTSGFINGIKNMVKGFIQPLNCDFYTDHHKAYNPKYRNNYMRDMNADMISFVPHQPEPHVQAVMIGLEMNMHPPSTGEAVGGGGGGSERMSATNVPKTVPRDSSSSTPPKTTEVVAIFTSEDFPELPAPRRSRSNTPAKTEKTPEPQQHQQQMEVQKETKEAEVVVVETPAPTFPKSTFFEIKCKTRPCGRRPTFGGRLKVVPPPFSLNKTTRNCRRECNSTKTSHEDCDTKDDGFEMFPNARPEECLFTSSFGACRPPRQRQISECSDDSFVVFFTEDADDLVILDGDDDDLDTDDETSSEEETDTESDDDDDDDDEDEDEEEEEDNGHDVVDSSYLGRNKTDRNKCNGTTTLLTSELAEHVQFDSGFEDKKVVTFNPQPVVHVMHAWNYAYRAARKGHWEDFARDRTRFQKRVERTSVYLNPILTPEHREKIYRSRFCENADNNQLPTNQTKQ